MSAIDTNNTTEERKKERERKSWPNSYVALKKNSSEYVHAHAW